MSTREQKKHDNLYTCRWVWDNVHSEMDYPSVQLHNAFIEYVQNFNKNEWDIDEFIPLSEPSQGGFISRLNSMNFLEHKMGMAYNEKLEKRTRQSLYRRKELGPSRFDKWIDIIKGVFKCVKLRVLRHIKTGKAAKG